MKNTRKLIPAFAMLLVAAVMMSTASFAWFTMNSTVKAEGIEVTAVAPASLWIAQSVQSGDPAWVSAITLQSENTGAPAQFKPVTTNTTTNFEAWAFKELTSEASALVHKDGSLPVADGTNTKTGVTSEGKVMVDGTVLKDADENDVMAYADSASYYKDKFLVKLESTAGDKAKLSVKVKVTDKTVSETDPIWRALRVAVVTSAETLTFQFDTDPASGTDTGTIGDYTEAQTFAADIVAGAADTVVVVYVWFEGTDTDCMNSNALNTDTFKIDLVFDIGNVTKPQA